MRTVFHSLAAALPAIRASATHTANFFIILLVRAARLDKGRAANAGRPGSWPLAAILGDQKCGSEGAMRSGPRRIAGRALRVARVDCSGFPWGPVASRLASPARASGAG